MTDKRYQVFVSSTFEDLREERAAVIGALLQIDCFPAGMELFPAADDDSLTLIRSVIDDSDYYLLILGGRYGSIDPASGKSYTQLEYEYALASGKPTIALIHSNPASLPAERTERTDDGRKRFEEAELKKKNCRYWKDRGELIAAVFTGVQHLKKTRPGVGWTKGGGASDEALKDELLRVRREAESLATQLAETRSHSAPDDTLDLAQGSEITGIVVNGISFNVAWEQIIRSVLPQTFGAGAENSDIASALADLAREQYEGYLDDPTLSRSSFGKVINQMVALGLIEGRPRTPSSLATLWVATPYGAKVGSRLVALKRREAW